MALSFLVDTSVLKRVDRFEVRSVVEPLAATGRLGRVSICERYLVIAEAAWTLVGAPGWERGSR